MKCLKIKLQNHFSVYSTNAQWPKTDVIIDYVHTLWIGFAPKYHCFGTACPQNL